MTCTELKALLKDETRRWCLENLSKLSPPLEMLYFMIRTCMVIILGRPVLSTSSSVELSTTSVIRLFNIHPIIHRKGVGNFYNEGNLNLLLYLRKKIFHHNPIFHNFIAFSFLCWKITREFVLKSNRMDQRRNYRGTMRGGRPSPRWKWSSGVTVRPSTLVKGPANR